MKYTNMERNVLKKLPFRNKHQVPLSGSYLHHCYSRVYLGWQWNVYLILVPVHPYSHALLDVRRSDSVSQVYHELSKLLDIYYVLGVLSFGVDDLGAPRYL